MKTNSKIKTSITILGILGCCAFNTAYGQWALTGNNISPTNFLGSIDDTDLVFKTHNIERMRILAANGNISMNGNGSAFIPNSVLSVGGVGSSLFEVYSYQAGTANGATALYGIATMPSGSNHTYGEIGKDSSGAGFAYGNYGISTGSAGAGRSYGSFGIAGGATSGYNYGVYGTYNGTGNAAGVYGVEGSLGDVNVNGKWAGYFHGRLYADTISINSTSQPIGYQLYVNGTAAKTGSSAWQILSDKRLKQNVSNFTDGLNVITKVNTVWFNYNGIGGASSTPTYIGVIAQDIQKIAPYCVKTADIILSEADAKRFSGPTTISGKRLVVKDSSNGKSVTTEENTYKAQVLTYNADGILYCLVNSVKEMNKTIDSLRNALKNSQQLTPVQTAGTITNVQQVDLSSLNTPILYQNNPNPFGVNGTKINYYLPEGTMGATIVFYDTYGNKIKEEQLSQTGMGTLNINAENLNSGIYSYSLIVNGQIIDSKKMAVAK